MKYIGYFSNNYDCRNRQSCSGEDVGAKIEFDSLEDLYKFAICIATDEPSWDDYLEEWGYEEGELSVQDLEDTVADQDIGDGSPFLFYATDEDGNVVYDLGALEGWGDEPAYRLEGPEADFGYYGMDDYHPVPNKVLATYVLQDINGDSEDEDDDWDEEDDEEYIKNTINYLLNKEKVAGLDKEERAELQELIDEYGYPNED